MMGTPIRFLGWVPYQGLGTPLRRPHLRNGDLIGHSPGAGDRRASTAATGRGNDPSIPESLWERDRGCFGGPVGVPHGREPRGVVGSQRVMPEIHSPGGDITRHAEDAGQGSRHVAPLRPVASLNRWRGTLTRAKRGRGWGSGGKGGGMERGGGCGGG